MAHIRKAGRGVIVYLREGSAGVAHVVRRSDAGLRGGVEDHATAQHRRNEWLEIGLGAQILRDLGIQSIELLATRERHYVGLEGFGVQISKTVLME
jgi:3,4-dihydroxy 2-butanone 4-phosphate synthase/GTP cyclohydrolase II